MDPLELEADKVWTQAGFRPANVIAKMHGREATKSFGTQKGHLGVHSMISHFPVPYSSESRSSFTHQALVETSALPQGERLRWNCGEKSIPELTINPPGQLAGRGHRLW